MIENSESGKYLKARKFNLNTVMLNLNGGSLQMADLCVCWKLILPQISIRYVIEAKNKTNRPLMYLFVLL